jgi:hypothetical protein
MTSSLQNSTDETKVREWRSGLAARACVALRFLFLWIVERHSCEVGFADVSPRLRTERKLGTAHVGMWVISPERRCANSVNSGLWPKSITRSGLSPSP